jgi:hypothetical protein
VIRARANESVAPIGEVKIWELPKNGSDVRVFRDWGIEEVEVEPFRH